MRRLAPPGLSRDGRVLFATCAVRTFAYGSVAVILGPYLHQLGFDGGAIGAIFTAALAGGAVGIISPSGREVGPFSSVEEAILPDTIPEEGRTAAYAAYNLTGSLAGALGSLAAGLPALVGLPEMVGYQALLWGYAGAALTLLGLFASLSSAVEARGDRSAERRRGFGVRRSRAIVARLSALFALDSFASGLVLQGLVAYWFYLRFDVDTRGLGAIFFGANLLGALSFLAAPAIASRLGLLKAMVLPHLAGNILVLLVPLMPSLSLAVGAWLARYLVAQLDRPPRQSYTMAIIDREERAAASGVMAVAHTNRILEPPR